MEMPIIRANTESLLKQSSINFFVTKNSKKIPEKKFRDFP